MGQKSEISQFFLSTIICIHFQKELRLKIKTLCIAKNLRLLARVDKWFLHMMYPQDVTGRAWISWARPPLTWLCLPWGNVSRHRAWMQPFLDFFAILHYYLAGFFRNVPRNSRQNNNIHYWRIADERIDGEWQ